MTINYLLQPDEYAEKAIEKIAFDCGILFDTARLLYSRGIKDVPSAKKFLSPGKNNFNDPYLFKDMTNIVRRLVSARADGEKVLIFGDYDVDGISAATVLKNCFSVFGIDADAVVPEREEGYGINLDKIFSMPTKPDLIVTVDCGISEAEKIAVLKEKGIDVIVTDHHEPPEVLPDCLLINPKTDGCGYPFDGLCGAGVAYKLGYALIGETADEFLDFVALATVSDSMNLVGENRDIVSEGLKLFNYERLRPCFSALLGENVKMVTSQTLAFAIAPKINAGGRMGNAGIALKLFLSKSQAEIARITDLLKAYNVQRQVECENIYKEALTQVSGKKDYVIAVKDPSWNAGFTGIVASRLAENLSRPVIVFGGQNGVLKGSARSVGDINVFDVLSSAKELYVSFGGHAQAAGVSIEEKDFDEFKSRINDYFIKAYGNVIPEKSISVEWEATSPFSMRFIKELERLEPFGVGNKRPCFGVKVNSVAASPLKNGSPHYSFDTPVISMLDFNAEKDVELLSLPIEKTVVFETNYSVFRGKESVKGFVREIVPNYGDIGKAYPYIVENELEKITCDSEVKALPFDGEYKNDVLYAVSDYNTLKKVPFAGKLPISLFYPEQGGVVVSPKTTEGFDKVIYLDKPAAFLSTDKNVCCNFSTKGYNFIRRINPDRESMAIFYKEIVKHAGERIVSPIEFYNKNGFSIGIENFLFALKVFVELKILNIDNNVIKISGIKSNLSDSHLYNVVVRLKEEL
ncbi:MAG: single-stranded-DNA-specific exonuclease RecJ [Clostridia bacterium]|nr:single-stranded-DNA-specific exonuclease RecJ [Clostridia bacterium]